MVSEVGVRRLPEGAELAAGPFQPDAIGRTFSHPDGEEVAADPRSPEKSDDKSALRSCGNNWSYARTTSRHPKTVKKSQGNVGELCASFLDKNLCKALDPRFQMRVWQCRTPVSISRDRFAAETLARPALSGRRESAWFGHDGRGRPWSLSGWGSQAHWRDSNGSRRHGNPFPIIGGASAGAINGAALAMGATTFRRLPGSANLWASLKPSDVFRCDFASQAHNSLIWMLDLSFGGILGGGNARSLLDATPLRHFLKNAS